MFTAYVFTVFRFYAGIFNAAVSFGSLVCSHIANFVILGYPETRTFLTHIPFLGLTYSLRRPIQNFLHIGCVDISDFILY